jgi:hypothetical protein
MTVEEEDLRRAIHDACQAIFMEYERGASQADIKDLVDVLEHLDRHAAALGLGFEPLQPSGPRKP